MYHLIPKVKATEINYNHQQLTTAIVIVCLGVCGVYVNPSLVDGGVIVRTNLLHVEG